MTEAFKTPADRRSSCGHGHERTDRSQRARPRDEGTYRSAGGGSGVDRTTIGAGAAEAERAGFASVGVIDRLVYDNLEPLTVLAGGGPDRAGRAVHHRAERGLAGQSGARRANPIRWRPMEMRPFLLDQWLSKHQFASPPIEYDLASSTGPRWTVRELLALVDDDVRERLFDRPLYYAPPEGGAELREAIAAVAGVTGDDVRITTGAAEALWILLIDAAEEGANVVLPHPGFPTFAEAARVLGLEVRQYHLRAERSSGSISTRSDRAATGARS